MVNERQEWDRMVILRHIMNKTMQRMNVIRCGQVTEKNSWNDSSR
jgi:hypothetical protein